MPPRRVITADRSSAQEARPQIRAAGTERAIVKRRTIAFSPTRASIATEPSPVLIDDCRAVFGTRLAAGWDPVVGRYGKRRG